MPATIVYPLQFKLLKAHLLHHISLIYGSKLSLVLINLQMTNGQDGGIISIILFIERESTLHWGKSS